MEMLFIVPGLLAMQIENMIIHRTLDKEQNAANSRNISRI